MAIVATVAMLVASAIATGLAVRDRWSGSSLLTASSSERRSVSTPAAHPEASPSPSSFQDARGLDVAAVAAKVDPAVVNITSTLAGGGGTAGTGMVITSSGAVLTNNHVIAGTTDISVQIGGTGPRRAAKVVGYDVRDDIALLQAEKVSDLQTVAPGDSSQVSVDDRVVVIGNALGRGNTPSATPGVVAALGQSVTATDDSGANAETLTDMIQVDGSIQPGDSGGPLANADGQVIAMTTAGAGSRFRRASASSVGFAIPINRALSIARQIEAGHASANIHIGSRGLLGVQVQDVNAPGGLDSPYGRRRGLDRYAAPVSAGALIVDVSSGTPAESAGLAAGDVIVSVGGTTIGSASELGTAMVPYHPRDKVDVGWVDASGHRRHATVSLIDGPPA